MMAVRHGATLRAFADVAVLTLALALGVAAPALARPLDDVAASKVLRVVVYDDNKPFSYTEEGQAKGIDVDLGRALARELGVAADIIVRMPGEKIDDDLRANVWRGPLTGGGIGDVMLHVPADRELALRNPQVVIGSPYFEERVAVAILPGRATPIDTFDVFKREKIGVKLGTVADYFLMRYDNGALVNNVSHFIRAKDAVDRFLSGEIAALMGARSEIEGWMHERQARANFVEPPMPGIVRRAWTIGMAVHEHSRDLGYALTAALKRLQDSGELADIFARHGVTYVPPALY